MKSFWSEKTIIARCEFILAILLTLVALAIHVAFFFHAGPLWRDEISSLALATKPTLPEFWKSLPLDPFPATYFFLLRGWSALGFANNDLALRGFGLLIGLSVIAALWLSCYLIDKSPPVWPLALFVFNPLALEGGDTLRPYGFDLIWIALAFALVWRIASGGFGKRIVLCAFITVLLSVQSVFTNALVLFAIGVGATAVLLKRRRWRECWLIISIGAVAALSLIFYLPVVQSTRDWAQIVTNENDVVNVLAVARDAIAGAGSFAEWTWLALVAVVLLALLRNCERIIFAAVTLLVAVAATIIFLCAVHYLVFPRYFLPAMVVAALSIHMFWNTLPKRTALRFISLILALIVAVTSIPSIYASANTRMTNCDQLASALEQRATADDLIIVTSFLYGISFRRYYRGPAPWLTVPQLSDFSLHRWDLLKRALAGPDPVPDLVARAESVLRDGHKVFLVGKLGPAPATEPEPLPPAPNSQFGWQMEAYTNQWKSKLTYWFEHHAVHGTNLPVDGNESVNPLEQLGLFEISGLR